MSRPAGRVLRQLASVPLSASNAQCDEKAAQEHGRQMRDQVMSMIPDAAPFIADLVRVGLIPGWRAVSYCGPLRPMDPNAMTLDRICLESDFVAMQQQKRGRQ